MYRARVQAVSGNKIYADGKWLTCIGNKNFRTGEMVWTDGRCAYGHFQESQQPPIITAPPDDEGIPIVFRDRKICILYTFRKNKLMFLDTLETEKQIQTMINDKTSHVFLDSEYNVLAENVDDKGNIFRIIYSGYHTTEPVTIWITKNNEWIKTIDLEPFRDATLDATPSSGESFYVYSQGKKKHYTYIQWGFIENENNWALIFSTNAYEDTLYNFFINHEVTSRTTLIFERFYYMTQSETTILLERTDIQLPLFNDEAIKGYNKYISQVGSWLWFFDPDDVISVKRDAFISHSQNHFEISSVKFPLQDNYYYQFSKMHECTNDTYITAYQTAEITVFSPSDKKIFTIPCSISAKLLLRKINNSSFLFGIESFFYHEDNMKSGLYLYKNENFKLLVENFPLNQRLRPMKKIKGWQNRIKEISLNTEEGEN